MKEKSVLQSISLFSPLLHPSLVEVEHHSKIIQVDYLMTGIRILKHGLYNLFLITQDLKKIQDLKKQFDYSNTFAL